MLHGRRSSNLVRQLELAACTNFVRQTMCLFCHTSLDIHEYVAIKPGKLEQLTKTTTRLYLETSAITESCCSFDNVHRSDCVELRSFIWSGKAELLS